MRKPHLAVNDGSAKGPVELTFDAGYEDFPGATVPVPERSDVSAATGRLDRRARYAYACGWRTLDERGAYYWPRIRISDRDGFLRFVAKSQVYLQCSTAIRAISILLDRLQFRRQFAGNRG